MEALHLSPTRAPFLRPQADAFVERILACLDEGALALLISIGHRTGLFDGLASVPSLTAAELAQRAGLDARYVRQWLEAMRVGGIVDHEPGADRYSMPTEHAACLSREGGRRNLAIAAQWIAGLGSIEDSVIEYFVRGGQGELPGRAEEIAEEERRLIARSRIPRVLRRAPGLIRQLEKGIDVLDLDAGSGAMLMELARTYPRSRFQGRDAEGVNLEQSRSEGRARGLTNLEFVGGCVLDEELTRRFDLVFWLRTAPRGADSARVFEWCYRALNRRGRLIVVDRGHPDDLRPVSGRPAGLFQHALACLQLLPGACEAELDGANVLRRRESITATLITLGFSSVDVVRTDDRFYSTYLVER